MGRGRITGRGRVMGRGSVGGHVESDLHGKVVSWVVYEAM